MKEVRKIAVVTGSTRGIGFETVRQLAEHGHRCYLSGRNQARTEAAALNLQNEGLDVQPLVIDIASGISIDAAVRHIEDEDGYLDILVNNAAIRVEEYGKRPSEQLIEEWVRTFETNLFGTVAVTTKFLPLLLKSHAGRIVNVSSLLGSIATHCDPSSYAYSDTFKALPAYSASKSAVNSWTAHLSYELRGTPIKVNSAHPGYTRTDMNDGAGNQEPADGARTSVQLALLPKDGPSGIFTHLGDIIPW